MDIVEIIKEALPNVAIAVVSIGLVTFVVLATAVFTKKTEVSYKSKKHLFTKAEFSFLSSLRIAADNLGFSVNGKTRVVDLISVYGPRKLRIVAFNKISSRHVDFVLLKDSNEVIAAIELDDKSHLKKSARQGDDLKNIAFAEAEIPLIRFTVKSSYRATEIESVIRSKVRNGSDDFNNRGVAKESKNI